MAALLGALALCWVLLTPPGAGADEPSHVVRAGMLADGEVDLLVRVDQDRLITRRLPPEYAVPEPGCYAWAPQIPVDCAVGTAALPGDDGRVLVATTAHEYPVWGHAVAAIGSALPGDGGIWAARSSSAMVSIALVASALVVAVRTSLGAVVGVLLALTPMAWSTFALVNPSSLATAGAVALWVTLLTRRPGWLMACGWTALALPRRDGLVWACLIVAALVLIDGRDVLGDVWRRRRRLAGPLALAAAATLMTLVWDVTNAIRVAQLGALAPFAVAAAWCVRWGWDRLGARPGGRLPYAAAVGAAGVAAVVLMFVARPGGWNGGLTRTVVGQTANNFNEAIGVLGWLDTPLPRPATAAWIALVAALAVGAVRAGATAALARAGATLCLSVVTAWAFELQQGGDSGNYWQGRYSLPLLVGVPIALGLAAQLGRRALVSLGIAVLALLNVAAWAAARRWAVGVDGTLRPWKWGAELMPVHPLAVLAAHAVITAAIAWFVVLGDSAREGMRR